MTELRNLLDVTAGEKPAPRKTIPFAARYWWAAAAVAIALTATIYFFIPGERARSLSDNENEQLRKIPDVAPGANKAILTLANGTQVILDSAGNGVVGQEGGAIVFKKNGQLEYASGEVAQAGTAYNMLSTPRGGQYALTLADGTKIWLNSASILQYPTAFSGKERKVTVTGEAYFEVAKNPSRPFIVSVIAAAGGQPMQVEVVGTHFNINAYADEQTTNTTLLEGSIRLKAGKFSGMLKPGQQAQLNAAATVKVIDDADLESTMAWKEGQFQFENADIQSVMRQLARWYDIEVEYKGTIDKHFGGTISRNVNLSKVLSLLQKTGEVKFSINGNKVLVSP